MSVDISLHFRPTYGCPESLYIHHDLSSNDSVCVSCVRPRSDRCTVCFIECPIPLQQGSRVSDGFEVEPIANREEKVSLVGDGILDCKVAQHPLHALSPQISALTQREKMSRSCGSLSRLKVENETDSNGQTWTVSVYALVTGLRTF